MRLAGAGRTNYILPIHKLSKSRSTTRFIRGTALASR
jgi:hypothetical protein